MDPTSLISQTPIPEIWQFPLVGVPPNSRFVNTRNSSVAESTVTDYSNGSRGRRRKRESAPPSEDESSKLVSTSSGNDAIDTKVKHIKEMHRDENVESKAEVEASSGLCNRTSEQNTQPVEAPKQDYIHVRARRGQATDSHSLAERARRERISERMKILQDLVPGCNKVIGKASVLDEIINYIQALQRQVEFLSMKLEAVDPQTNSGIEGFPQKDFGMQAYENPSLAFSTRPAREYGGQGSAAEWLHMQVGGAFERVT